MRDDRPAVYLEDCKVIYRASSLGRCPKMLWAARSNMDRLPIPDIVQRGMDEGTALEPTILELLHDKFDWGFSYHPQFQVELVCGSFNGFTYLVRGKMDERRDDGLPVDVKAFTDDDVQRFHLHGFDAYPGYAWQQSVYAIGLDSPEFYMPIFNKATWQIEPWSLTPHKARYTRDDIRNRILTIEEAYENNVMPTECPRDFGCQYPYLHEALDDAVPDTAIPVIEARIALSSKIQTLDAARKVLDEKIKSLLQQDVSYHLDGYSITVFANPARFNTRAAQQLLTEAGIDWRTDPDYHVPGAGTQLRITPPRKKGTDA